jgi:CCR4-NOT transcriptional regulation complex NOT5 subunit
MHRANALNGFCHTSLLILASLQQMEKFKACEKEMKTKAFSKEGLIQSAKLDPKAQEKLEQTQWLQTCVEELLLQVETAEAEIETLQQGGRKKGKVGATAQDRLEELERLNERRKWHISRLEIMLRLLDNGTLSTEQVQGLKDDVNYFVEDNSVRRALIINQTAGLRFGERMMTTTRMRAFTMISTSTRKKKSLVG